MTIDDLLQERHTTHGRFEDVAQISQCLKTVIRTGPKWTVLSEMEREALDMICTKMSRIVSGKLHFADSWRDISGYAQLASEKCGDD